MREIRPSGSEGGGASPRSPYPYQPEPIDFALLRRSHPIGGSALLGEGGVRRDGKLAIAKWQLTKMGATRLVV